VNATIRRSAESIGSAFSVGRDRFGGSRRGCREHRPVRRRERSSADEDSLGHRRLADRRLRANDGDDEHGGDEADAGEERPTRPVIERVGEVAERGRREQRPEVNAS